MSNATIHKFRSGEFELSHMLYRCDLQHVNGEEIRLGVLAELAIADCHVFGMMVRTALSGDEVLKLPGGWSKTLLYPVVYFDEVFEDAWVNGETGGAIAYLSDQYRASLLVKPPTKTEIPKDLFEADEGELLAEARYAVMEKLEEQANYFLHNSATQKFRYMPHAKAA